MLEERCNAYDIWQKELTDEQECVIWAEHVASSIALCGCQVDYVMWSIYREDLLELAFFVYTVSPNFPTYKESDYSHVHLLVLFDSEKGIFGLDNGEVCKIILCMCKHVRRRTCA